MTVIEMRFYETLSCAAMRIVDELERANKLKALELKASLKRLGYEHEIKTIMEEEDNND